MAPYPGGGEGIRTPDLDSAIVALFQLSYTPALTPFYLTTTAKECQTMLFRVTRLVPVLHSSSVPLTFLCSLLPQGERKGSESPT